MKKQPQSAFAKTDALPQIGIFWLQYRDGEFSVFHKISYPVECGSEYGDFIVADNSHYETWEALKKDGVVPQNSEYVHIPRGRVLYNRVLKRYKVFTGKWVTPAIKKAIADAFDLPNRGVIWDMDEHYNGFKRLFM
jgi:hypothetical protein